MTENKLLNVDPDDLVALTVALVDTSSVSKDEALLCDHLFDYLNSIRDDISIERINNSLVVNVDGDGEAVIFAGHLDTVPPSKDGDSSKPARIDGDKLYGLGSADMKSGLAVMIKLLKHINVKSTFIFYEGEEIAEEFNGLLLIENERPELLAGKWAVLLEPTDGELEMGCQGCINATITFNGVAAHSARAYLGENAIHKSIETMTKVKELSSGFETVLIESLPYKESMQITTINGGHAENVIPDSLRFNINYRFLPSRSEDEAKKIIQELCVDADLISFNSVAPGAMPAYDHPLVAIAKEKNVEVKPKVAWTDVSRFYALGIPALNCGPGLVEMCHKADEHISIELLESTYDLLFSLIRT